MIADNTMNITKGVEFNTGKPMLLSDIMEIDIYS